MGQYNLPDNVRVFGLSSRVEHRVSGTAYTHARVAAFMGLRIINEVIEQNSDTENRLRYLCNLAPQRYHQSYRPRLPESMNGAEFQQQYGSTSDAVTSVDPAACYRVRACTDHPVFENQRVQAFIACMERARACDRTALVEAGGLMYASHWSYGWNCHLGCRETDLLVDMVRRHGPDRGLYGAKITGGGSGGTVAVLAEADAEPLLHEVAAEYEQRTGLRPDIFDSTSPGACAFGTRTYHVKDNDD
jgi:L-arabinokinase